MLLKILGLIDIISGIFFLLLAFGIQTNFFILWPFIVILGIKSSFILSKSIASVIDLCAVIILVITIFNPISNIFYIITAFFLIQKGAISFL